MRKNRVRNLIEEGKMAIGTYVSLTDPQIVEMIGLAGFDAAFIDMEHTAFDLPLISEMIRAAELADVTSLVRVPDNDAKLISRLLDIGAQGIIIPHIDGIEGAKQAVAAVRYPPIGARGSAGSTRSQNFGAIPQEEHIRQSNQEILLIVMAEDDKAIADIDKIASLEGIDIIAIGLMDLFQNMGIQDPKDPRFRVRLEEIAEIIKQIGKAKLSIPMNNPALPLGPEELMKLGVCYFHVGPTPPVILMKAWQEKVQNIHQLTGRI